MLKGLKYTLHSFCVSESQTVWLNEFPLHSVSNTYPSKLKFQSVHARKKLCYRVAVSVRLINASASKVLLLWWFLLVQKYKYFNKETKRISILIDTAWTVKGMEIKIADVFILKWIQNSLIATKKYEVGSNGIESVIKCVETKQHLNMSRMDKFKTRAHYPLFLLHM